MPAALIVGAFGQGNPGDEALLDAAVLAVRGCPGWEPVVATARPSETARRLGVEAVPARASMTARAATHADALVVGGGTIFKELHPSTGRRPGALLRRTLAITGAFRTRLRPVAMVGVGAAPIRRRSNQRMARSIALHADLLVLRDDESACLLAGMGVPTPLRVGADLSWLALPSAAGAEAGPPAAGPDAPIGVAMSHLADPDGLLDALVRALRPALRAGRRIELEPWQGSPRLGADARLAMAVAGALGAGARVVPPPADLVEATRRMAGRSALLAMRFHSAVAAAQAGIPFTAVAHEPKLAAIARRAGQRSLTIADLATAPAWALDGGLAGPPPDPLVIAEEHRRAEATAELLRICLTGRGETARLAHLDLVPEPIPSSS